MAGGHHGVPDEVPCNIQSKEETGERGQDKDPDVKDLSDDRTTMMVMMMITMTIRVYSL